MDLWTLMDNSGFIDFFPSSLPHFFSTNSAAVMLYFGVSSFWRAKKIGKS